MALAAGARGSKKEQAGKLLAGTMDSWLIWNLSGGSVHATDYSNASRTQLFNIRTLQWDAELAGLFGIPMAMLPEVYGSDCIFGYIDNAELFLTVCRLPALSAIRRQPCSDSSVRSRGHRQKAPYGTGTSVLMHVGDDRVPAQDGLSMAIAWGIGGKVEYALEAIIHCSGDSLNSARDTDRGYSAPMRSWRKGLLAGDSRRRLLWCRPSSDLARRTGMRAPARLLWP